MIRDQENTFSDAQALTATAISTNVIDLGPLTSDDGTNLVRDIGAGKEAVWVVVTVHTVLDSAAEGASLVVALESDDNTSLSSATVHYTSATIAEAALVAGYELKFRIPPGAYQRYLGLRYTVSGEDFTSGKITASLARDVENRRDYARGHSESVA
jgi:hypothetical protein